MSRVASMADAELIIGTSNLSQWRRMLIPKNPVPLPVRGITTRGRLTVLPLTRMLRLSSRDTMMSTEGCSISCGCMVSGQDSSNLSVSYLVELACFCSITHSVSFIIRSWANRYITIWHIMSSTNHPTAATNIPILAGFIIDTPPHRFH